MYKTLLFFLNMSIRKKETFFIKSMRNHKTYKIVFESHYKDTYHSSKVQCRRVKGEEWEDAIITSWMLNDKYILDIDTLQ